MLSNIGALRIISTILGVSYYTYSIMGANPIKIIKANISDVLPVLSSCMKDLLEPLLVSLCGDSRTRA